MQDFVPLQSGVRMLDGSLESMVIHFERGCTKASGSNVHQHGSVGLGVQV